MLFDFFKKQTKKSRKIHLIKSVLNNLRIPERQKELYRESLDVLGDEELDKLYVSITKFVKQIEIENIGEIYKTNFSSVEGMRKKDAKNKQEEINSVNFLLNNL
ncbi:MAG: hypothetical protein N4A38_03375 [Candidatus Gracilibacteria bacterium]|nr:hypothetical protein [Candidatus Gracilibacteria bacterium]